MEARLRILAVITVVLLLSSSVEAAAESQLQRLPAEHYVMEAQRAVRQSLRLPPADVEIEPSRRHDDIEVRGGNLELKVHAPANVAARMIVWVDVRVDAQVVKRIPVALNVHCWAEALMTVTPLNARMLLTPEMVAVKRVDVASAVDDFIVSIDKTNGMRLRRDVGREHVLRQRDLEPRPAVERGAAVQLAALVGGVLVQRAGVAESEGHAGQPIRVRIEQNGKVLRAIVTGNNKAVVSGNG